MKLMLRLLETHPCAVRRQGAGLAVLRLATAAVNGPGIGHGQLPCYPQLTAAAATEKDYYTSQYIQGALERCPCSAT